MRHPLHIFVSNGQLQFSIERNGLGNGREWFSVSQKREGTRVYRLDYKSSQAELVPLRHNRYSLASPTPACGKNFTDFDNDFWEAIEQQTITD